MFPGSVNKLNQSKACYHNSKSTNSGNSLRCDAWKHGTVSVKRNPIQYSDQPAQQVTILGKGYSSWKVRFRNFTPTAPQPPAPLLTILVPMNGAPFAHTPRCTQRIHRQSGEPVTCRHSQKTSKLQCRIHPLNFLSE